MPHTPPLVLGSILGVLALGACAHTTPATEATPTTPAATETPAQETPTQETPTQETPAQETPTTGETGPEGTQAEMPRKIEGSAYHQCSGESSQWMGPCCVDAYCMPATGEACPSADDLRPHELTGVFMGSGACACGPIEGPVEIEGEDGCCYTIGVQACTGRPLPVEGQQRLASLQRRGDWAPGTPKA